MTVIWTRKAETSFNGIVDYLLEMWTIEIATNFVDIVEHSQMFKTSEYDNKSREALIIKHMTMFYRILSDGIEIEYFWGNFDNPKKIRELLKSE